MKNKSTNRKNGLWTASFGEIGATLKALQDYGVTLEHLARLRAEPEYAKRVAEYILRGGVEYSEHHKLARALMNQNFFGIEDWTRFYKVSFSWEQLRQTPEFPWNKDILLSTCPLCCKIVKDCHFAFLGLDRINGDPLTFKKLQELHPATGHPKFASYYSKYDPHYSGKKFITETTMDFRWYLLHTDIVPGSENKTLEEQKAMLPAEYEIPSIVAETAKDLFVCRKTGTYAISAWFKRCADIRRSDGYDSHVSVRCYSKTEGLDFNNTFTDINVHNKLCIAASRKPGV
ncbi:hypothetical protein EPN15_04375 [Patescibacteria group bacterium]|nr:MAG: hypothetical protein EPN15_04375 [Patescibacteria group bacterium]